MSRGLARSEQAYKQVLAIDGMLERLRSLVDLLVLKRKWWPDAYCVLEAVFLKGSIARG
jgi:hypothetical protein